MKVCILRFNKDLNSVLLCGEIYSKPYELKQELNVIIIKRYIFASGY